MRYNKEHMAMRIAIIALFLLQKETRWDTLSESQSPRILYNENAFDNFTREKKSVICRAT